MLHLAGPAHPAGPGCHFLSAILVSAGAAHMPTHLFCVAAAQLRGRRSTDFLSTEGWVGGESLAGIARVRVDSAVAGAQGSSGRLGGGTAPTPLHSQEALMPICHCSVPMLWRTKGSCGACTLGG